MAGSFFEKRTISKEELLFRDSAKVVEERKATVWPVPFSKGTIREEELFFRDGAKVVKERKATVWLVLFLKKER